MTRSDRVQQLLAQQRIFKAILKERSRQDAKFGSMPRGLTPAAWITVLTEELGEVARATLEGDRSGYVQEWVQVAAAALAALEDFSLGQATLELTDVCPPIIYAGGDDDAMQTLL